MKKVFNWTIGSFFRTIGRTIAFLVMGGLVYYLLSYNGIDIKNLFLEDVKASTYEYQWISGSKWSNDWGNTYNNTTNADGYYYLTDTITSGQNNNSKSYWFKFDSSFNVTNQVDSFDVNILMKPTSIEYIALAGASISCLEDSPTTQCTFQASSNGVLVENQFALTLEYFVGTETQFTPCYSKASSGNIISFTCPVTRVPISGFHIVLNSLRTMNYTLGHYFGLTFKRDTTQAIIDSQEENTQAVTNQTQQQQQQHQEMMESNTTQAESSASDFFGNFTQSDHGGLNSIVTAPLNTIRSLLSNSCTNLVLPLPFVNENITLPCMNDIYTTHFGLFFSLYQTIILAIISYRCIRSIFFDIHGFTDPDDDRIEVMDL